MAARNNRSGEFDSSKAQASIASSRKWKNLPAEMKVAKEFVRVHKQMAETVLKIEMELIEKWLQICHAEIEEEQSVSDVLSVHSDQVILVEEKPETEKVLVKNGWSKHKRILAKILRVNLTMSG